ncbi:MAG: quinoprotein dehydrogenase-associated putative ABC transporter substrate-binding protein [Burkholderiales bacterium]|nr:quinoprotein dehydrogenase-associated putative ABC transporter substrate-binding protein [Burkholderiales bacterium]MDE2157502.1 quinoprotein dehydrogenase-associated putative ABC transporter substrate-binding protein [Burkholderiales bacterium]MDE2503152.1 quinoprotein dehydrogenase-associated putative ABC transporter substrate-binding protein [Burkholderiales bacterium]
MRLPRPRQVLAACAAALACSAGAQDLERHALRVCQDPNNLPFSDTAAEGIENKLAELFGKQLGLPVTYYSFPERFNFVRNTLKYKLPGDDYPCDIMMGVPVGFDQVSVTKPYYRSTYALVIPQGHGMDAVHSGEDFLHLDPALLRRLRIGIYDRSPASAWLARHGLVDSGVPYHILSADPSQYPGQIIENDLAAGKIDVAIVWGPIAGFYAKRVKSPRLVVVPLHSEPGVKFDYAMAMGVRYGEQAWKARVEKFIDDNQAPIEAILKEYGVPLVDKSYASSRP